MRVSKATTFTGYIDIRGLIHSTSIISLHLVESSRVRLFPISCQSPFNVLRVSSSDLVCHHIHIIGKNLSVSLNVFKHIFHL